MRSTLHRCDITYQCTRMWKQSNDPEFHAKYARVKALYDKCPIRNAVICRRVRSLVLRPYHGRTWEQRGRVQQLPATYGRSFGVRHMLAFYDVHADVLGGAIYLRKGGEEFLHFLQELRKPYPRWMALYVILDNFSPHKRQDVREWASKNRIEMVFIATNASWMNRIECHFEPLRKFVLEGTFPRTHEELQRQLEEYLNRRNTHKRDEKLLRLQRRQEVA